MKCIQGITLSGLVVLGFGFMTSPSRDRAVTSEDKSSPLIAPEAVAGCYELNMSKWTPDLKLGEDAYFITPPPRVQILAERGKAGFEINGYLIRPAPGIPRSMHRASYWQPTGANSIHIEWTTGFSGLTMDLRVQGETLQGIAKTFWDFPRKRQTADVTARKTDCAVH